MQALIDVIIPVFLLVGFGYAASWGGFFKTEYVDGLMKFAQGFAIPCLLFSAIANLDLSQSFKWPILLSFYSGAFICFALGMIGARVLFKRDWEDAVAIGFAAFFSNSVLVGLPITERAFGADSLTGNYAIIAIHAPLNLSIGIIGMELAKARLANTSQTEALLFSRIYQGSEAVKAGFLDAAVPQEQVLATAMSYAEKLKMLPRQSFADSKLQLRKETLAKMKA